MGRPRFSAGVWAVMVVLAACTGTVAPPSASTRASSSSTSQTESASPASLTTLRRDGEIITYSPHDPRRRGGLVAQDPDTGEVRTLVAVDPPIGYDFSLISSAAWSADGRWVAFEVFHCGDIGSDAAGTGGLWVTSRQGEPRQLTRPCFEDPEVLHPAEVWAWSPTGAQLVVVRVSIDGDSLVLIDPATGDRTDLGDTAGHVASLAWSPDGTRITYGTDRGSVYSVGVRGGDHSLLASSLDKFVADGVYGSGSGILWSPDGSHIAVQAGRYRDNYPVDRLYLMNADGSDLHQLAKGSEIQSIYWSPGLSWSPDGTRMAYATFSGGGRQKRQMQIWTGSPDGSTPSLLFESAPGRIDSLTAGSPVWSPDGAHIAFESATTDGKAVWLVTNADGTGDAREIDELRYLSWRGGWYFCQCYG